MKIIFPLLVILAIVNERVQTEEPASFSMVGVAVIACIVLLHEIEARIKK